MDTVIQRITITEIDTVFVYRPLSASRTVSGTGGSVVEYIELTQSGLPTCTAEVKDNGDADDPDDPDNFIVRLHSDDDRWTLANEITREGTYTTVLLDIVEVVCVLEVDHAHDNAKWKVWCTKV